MPRKLLAHENAMVLLVHLLARLAILLGTGGTRAVLA